MDKLCLLKTLEAMAQSFEENKQYLTMLDTEIGDGDHGINMARGFNSVLSKLADFEELSISEILLQTGKTLIKDIAGSAGPLYGSAFKCASKVAQEKDNITKEDFTLMLENGILRIQQLGKAVENEKTMLDAMFPALRALKAGSSLNEALIEAEKGAEHTKEIIATKGRASYVGERSIGHKDPGAASFVLLLKVICNSI